MLWSVLLVLLFFSNAACALAYSSITGCSIDESFLPQRTPKIGSTQRYVNCSLSQGKVASKITWKRHGKVLKQGAGPLKWLGIWLNETGVKSVGKLRCEVILGKQVKSCGISHEAPHITSQKNTYEVYVGSSLVIPCRTTGNPKPLITWTKRSKSLAKQDMPLSIKQVKSRASLDMVIKKVSMMHSGIYLCHAVNRLGKDKHFVLIVVLYHTVLLPPKVVPLKHVVTVKKGTTAMLVCSAKNTPRRYTAVFWDHQGTRIKNTGRHHVKSRYSVKIVKSKYKAEYVDMSLTISQVTTKDIGLYTCGVVTHVGRLEDHVTLKIEG